MNDEFGDTWEDYYKVTRFIMFHKFANVMMSIQYNDYSCEQEDLVNECFLYVLDRYTRQPIKKKIYYFIKTFLYDKRRTTYKQKLIRESEQDRILQKTMSNRELYKYENSNGTYELELGGV